MVGTAIGKEQMSPPLGMMLGEAAWIAAPGTQSITRPSSTYGESAFDYKIVFASTRQVLALSAPAESPSHSTACVA